MEYNHISYPGPSTQTYGEATYQGMHTRTLSEWENFLFLCPVVNDVLK